jgi:hypothetical protein
MATADKIGLLVIHGMGDQTPGFSNDLRAEVAGRLAAKKTRFVWQEVYWADALEPRETDLWAAMKSAKEPDGSEISLDWQKVRGFVVHNFGDALAYHRSTKPGSTYADIHRIVSREIGTLKAALPKPDSPIVVLAHSLGAHIMSNYIWDHQPPGAVNDGLESLPTLAAMITFGCNIPLFSLDFDQATPIDLPAGGVTKPAVVSASKWLNFLDRDDVLGWPLRPLYEQNTAGFTPAQLKTVERIEEHEIDVGGLLTSWNPAAHASYWDDDDFTTPVASYLRTLLTALDS